MTGDGYDNLRKIIEILAEIAHLESGHTQFCILPFWAVRLFRIHGSNKITKSLYDKLSF